MVNQSAGPMPAIAARHAVAVCIGMVIGAGIFRTPAVVAGGSSGEAMFFAAWLIGGTLSILGALCYAELASTYPHPGGDYHFLERAFGQRIAFLYGWARLTVIQTGSLALLSYIFADYLSAVLPLGAYSSAIYAAALVVILTWTNLLGVRRGTMTQLWLTGIEVLGLGAVIVVGLLVEPATVPTVFQERDSAMGLILVFVLLTFGGWSEVVYLSAEIRGSQRRMASILVGSLIAVTALYLMVNWAFVRVLGLEGVASSDAVAADLMGHAFGPAGAAAISLLVAVAALTSANATAITGARTTYALGLTFHRLRWLSRWNPNRNTPTNALLLQAAIALALIVAAAFGRDEFSRIVEYTAPVFWFFMLLVGLAQFILRRKDPNAPRPFKTPLYPLVPALFCVTNAYLLYSSVAYTGISGMLGVGMLAAGALLLPLVLTHEKRS